MFPIEIDISEVAEEFDLMQEQINGMAESVLTRLVDTYEQTWTQLVGNTLRGTRSEYMRAMFKEVVDKNTIVVGLTSRQSKLALMIEDGASGFDIKESFKKSAKRKQKKDGGWYLTIPFRLATPDALGEASIFASKMPTEIHKIAKSKLKTRGSRLTIEDLPAHLSTPITREASAGRPAYTHKSPIFEGLVRGQKTSHGQYNTFRRVSDNSDPDSWQHPGFAAYNLMDQALQQMNIDSTIDMAVDDFLSER